MMTPKYQTDFEFCLCPKCLFVHSNLLFQICCADHHSSRKNAAETWMEKKGADEEETDEDDDEEEEEEEQLSWTRRYFQPYQR